MAARGADLHFVGLAAGVDQHAQHHAALLAGAAGERGVRRRGIVEVVGGEDRRGDNRRRRRDHDHRAGSGGGGGGGGGTMIGEGDGVSIGAVIIGSGSGGFGRGWTHRLGLRRRRLRLACGWGGVTRLTMIGAIASSAERAGS